MRKESLAVGLLATIVTVLILVLILVTHEGRTAPPVPTAFIEVTDKGFEPATATVPTGTTVGWTNIHAVMVNCNYTLTPHTVTSDTGLFKAELTQDNNVFGYTFIEVGVFGYHCELHPGEIGTVIVERVDEQLPGAKGAG